MKENPRETVADILRKRILTMALKPGAVLDEVELATEFGISRTPLREVIQRLGGEGYLVLEKNRGAKVASMDLATMRQFFQSAPMIYAAMSRLAAEQADSAGIEALKEVQRRYRKALGGNDPAETAMRNHEFHEIIGEMAGSPYLMPSLNRLLIDHTRIGQTFYHAATDKEAKRIKEAADQHDAMIDAIERRAAAEAVELTLQHWALSRDDLEQFVSPDPLNFEVERFAVGPSRDNALKH